MKYNGISFNLQWVRSKTEAEFIAEFKNTLSLTVPQLKEAYAMMVPGAKKEVGAVLVVDFHHGEE